MNGEGRIPATWSLTGENEHDQIDADNPNTRRGRLAYMNSLQATDEILAKFVRECMGCCCGEPRVKGQAEDTANLCE